jgi:serine/threonine-protein kinase HipA
MMGLLHYQAAARGGIFSFEFDAAWLKRTEALAFDPDLSLVEGPQYPASERESFGIFLDSSPDRWGRVLMQRRESVRARESKRKPAALNEWDYLLGVHDETRLGALRFQLEKGDPFVDTDDRLAAPPAFE